MSLFNVFDIAGTALSAQSVRLNVTASNLANANSISSSTGNTYRARQPIFQAVFDHALGADATVSGVRVKGIVESRAPLRREYQPGHPYADDKGYISLPNVNPIEEMANMMSASRAFQNNVEVINASKEMLLRTLTLGQ
ncbi:MAG: flagellar basal body rod protein FlgC [Gammaproteobacteria bacterium]